MKPACFLFLVASATLIFSCQNNPDGKPQLALNDSSSFTGLTSDAVKMVKTADMNIKVKSVEESTRNVSMLTHQYGGTVYNQTYQAAECDRKELSVSEDSLLVISTVNPEAHITVRVTSQNLESFLFDVADIGYYTVSSQLQMDDKSLTYLENNLKRKNREAIFHTPSKRRNDSSTTLQAIQVGDEAIQHFITNKSIDADVAYSKITLRLYQNALVKSEVIANYMIADYKLSFGERLSNSLQSGWNAFLDFIVAVSQLWMFILLALLAYAAYRYWQQRRKTIVQRQLQNV